jgi:hypothetical protein
MAVDETLIPISDDARLTAEYVNRVRKASGEKPVYGLDTGLVGSKTPVKG